MSDYVITRIGVSICDVTFSESLAQVMDVGFKMIDSPVHLADFGKRAFLSCVINLMM